MSLSLSLTPDAATFMWDELAQRLERFLAAWEQGEPPALAAYLPEEPLSLRRLVLVELIKIDLEQRGMHGCRRLLEEYAAEHPELLAEGEPPCDLIYEEYHLRRSAGEAVTLADYCQRFPRSAETLRRLAGSERATCSTQLLGVRRIEGIAAGGRIDDFDLLVELGKGAFGSVFLARQVSMQRLVALKVSADHGNEPQTLAQLDHPNIVRVYDQRQVSGRRVRLLYMQYAPGGTLAEVVQQVRQTPPAARSGALLIVAVNQAVQKSGGLAVEDQSARRRHSAATWPETVCRLGVQLAGALDYAHRQGILHRDVKPANVLLAGDGSPKLADFNISFCSQLEGATPAAYFGGSLAYMSPEQLEACNPTHNRQAKDLDGRSDLYALGVVLWELLYGDRPFQDEQLAVGWTETLQQMTLRRQSEQPVAAAGTDDGVSQRIQLVLRRTLSYAPSARPADGAELARELQLCLHSGAHDLLKGLATGWRGFARRWPFVALLAVNLPPFLIAGAFHFWYNYFEIIRKFPDAEPAFWRLMWAVNGLYYPLGAALVAWNGWPLLSALRRAALGYEVAAGELTRARWHALTHARFIVAVGLAEWLAAGLTFPIGIHLMTGYFPASAYVHFLLSSLVCGLISCGIPYLGTTWLAVRVFYPALLGGQAPDLAEQRELANVARNCGYSLFTAAVVPMLALFLLALASQNRVASLVLIVVSLVGFLAAYFIYGRILRDLAALNIATRPADTFGISSDTTERY